MPGRPPSEHRVRAGLGSAGAQRVTAEENGGMTESDDISALKRLVYARETPPVVRASAAKRLVRAEAESAAGERRAAEQRAAENVAAGGTSLGARFRRLSARRAVILVPSLVIVALAGAVVATSFGGSGLDAASSLDVGTNHTAAGDSNAGHPNAAETNPTESNSAATAEDAAVNGTAGGGTTGTNGGGAIAPGSASDATTPLAPAELSPALIFSTAQTAADHPGATIPGDTVESTYRLLSRGQYTPGSAFAARTPDGRMCLVVFAGANDFGELCQSAKWSELNGLQASVTTTTILNPRSGSNLAVSARFAASWHADGTFQLAVTDPSATTTR
ncbi:MAG: hypothetical protein JWQ64_2838 [Subtercola sp.]|nr:hypothetical protein [Subtercola sp.]